jgi:hypothetical protein
VPVVRVVRVVVVVVVVVAGVRFVVERVVCLGPRMRVLREGFERVVRVVVRGAWWRARGMAAVLVFGLRVMVGLDGVVMLW